MEYTKKVDGNTCQISMNGKFTFSDHNNFKSFFEIFNDNKIDKLEINIANIEFVDSAALGLFLLARDEASKTSKNLILLTPTGQVKKMFEISRFYELFDIVN